MSDESREQTRNLKRVSRNIGPVVHGFCQLRLATNPDFRASDLHKHVTAYGVQISPDSPARILRHLRQKGLIDYCVTGRATSSCKVTRA